MLNCTAYIHAYVGQYHVFIVTNLTLPEGGTVVPGAKALVGGLGGEAPPQGPGAEPLSGSFSAARRGTIKCNFTAAPQAGKEPFFCLFQIKIFLNVYRLNFRLLVCLMEMLDCYDR